MNRQRPTPFEMEVDAEAAGERLDAFLAERLPGLGRRGARRIVESERVLVDGAAARKSRLLSCGQIVTLLDPPPQPDWNARPDPGIPLKVLHEDRRLVAVEKPAGIATVPLGPREGGTLAGALAARWPECASLGRSRGDSGLLQRLDTGTSGVVLAARTPEAFSALLDVQRAGGLEKSYLALVAGEPSSLPSLIDAPLAASGEGGRRVRADERGEPARTELSIVERRGRWLLVEAVIRRGIRHQIRAHLAAAGLPIAQDRLYGGPEAPALERPFLHARRIRAARLPWGGNLDIECGLPADLANVLRLLID